MANKEHLKILRQGVGVWNQWRVDNPAVQPDLRAENLSMRDLRKANLQGTNLRSASFHGARLHGANLNSADFRRTDLGNVDLRGASIRGAALQRANLRGAALAGVDFFGSTLCEVALNEAGLHGVNLSTTNLCEANLSNAVMYYTILGDIDLSTVKGLETVRHAGPSIIGTDTLYRSRGKISKEFLRGAGVPENLIVHMQSLVGQPFDYFSCFISYSTKDSIFAERLQADLRLKGVRCWFAPHDVGAGKKLHDQIDQAIHLYEKMLLILSLDSMSSEWVKTEIAKARKREVEENKQMLFPIRLVEYAVLQKWECFDADTGKDSAREIREYFIPDFSNWKDQASYTQAFERLLSDLKGE